MNRRPEEIRGSAGEAQPEHSPEQTPRGVGDPPSTGADGVRTPDNPPPGEHEGDSSLHSGPWARSRVTNVFYGMVNAHNGVFGTADAGGGADTPRLSTTGRLGEREVCAVVGSFVPPACFDDARDLLAKQRVLVLTGTSGYGKRSGAICLLDAVGVAASSVTGLAPSRTLESLAQEQLLPGRGYVVLDWFGAGRGDSPAEQEYLWSVLRQRVEDSGAHLVLTSDRAARAGAAAPAFPWERPRAADVLCGRLGEEFRRAHPEAVDLAVRCLPEDHPVADTVVVAERMAAGEDPESAVGHVLRSSSRERVGEWFASAPDRRELAEAAALGLLPGARERDYEILANRLHARLVAAFPPEEGAAGEAEAPRDSPVPARRGRRGGGDHPLFRVECRDDGWMVRRFPEFVEEGDRAEVLRHLWEGYDVAFWDAVRGWVGSAVGHGVRRVHVAKGLAALAVIAFDEVHDLYLDRWSRGRGAAGREACVFALWFMCMEEEADLGPTVLHTVDRWLERGTPLQVEAAVQVWSGELGVRYPLEAANRLLDLVLDPDGHQRFEAAFAVGALFGSLIDRGGNGRSLLRFVRNDLADAQRFGSRRSDREYLLTAAFAMLTVPASEPSAPVPGEAGDGSLEPGEELFPEREGDVGPDGDGAAAPDDADRQEREGTGADPAVVRHVMLAPDQIPAVADLWTQTIRDRRTRRAAIDSLWSTLRALQRNGTEAREHARSMLIELSRLIPREEHSGFRASFISAARRRNDEDLFTNAVLDVLTGVFGDGIATAAVHSPDSDTTKKATPA